MRSEQLSAIGAISERLQPLNARWVAGLDAGHPSRGMNFAMVHFIAHRLGYADRKPSHDLRTGLPLAGEFPPAGVFRPMAAPPIASYGAWREGIPARNAAMIGRIKRSAGAEKPKDFWRKSKEEVEKGWPTQPAPVTEHAMRSIALTPRFAIEEERGDGGREFRAIEDLKAP